MSNDWAQKKVLPVKYLILARCRSVLDEKPLVFALIFINHIKG